jgi:glycosyltransferase involved in cell wall biosynthesis
MKNLKEKISIVMPAYNEEARIRHSIEETAKTFNDFGSSWELIVMDDGSKDSTYAMALDVSRCDPEHIIVKKMPLNRGKGRAIKRALRYVTGDYVVFLDADLELHPTQIQTLFDIMRLDNADVVIGSKLHPNSLVSYPLYRRIITTVYFYLVKMLFGLPCRDTQTGLKLFKTEVLRKVLPRILVKKFAFDLEILANAHHLGFRITDAPIVFHSQHRYWRIGWHAIYTTLLDTLAIFYRMYILKYYDRIDYHRRKNLAREFKHLRK